jgi:hypothetical protein
MAALPRGHFRTPCLQLVSTVLLLCSLVVHSTQYTVEKGRR